MKSSIFVLLILSFYMFTISLGSSKAQTQNTVGACSPAIAQTQGNVSVTCTMPDTRIRIAHYSGELSNKTYKEFRDFVEKNLGKVIYIEVYIGMETDIVKKDPTSHNITVSLYFQLDPNCGMSCGGQIFNIVGSESRDSISFAGGNHFIKGYFIPELIPGIHQGWFETSLEFVDKHKIIFSQNFVP